MSGTKDCQKQTRKTHTVRKSKDPERVHLRQNNAAENNNHKGC